MRTPACIACRRRKSRCKLEASSAACLMCRSHGTRCEFAPRHRRIASSVASAAVDTLGVNAASVSTGAYSLRPENPPRTTLNINADVDADTVHSKEQITSGQRLLGPIVDSDSRVLSGLVPCDAGGRRIARTFWTSDASGLSDPITFTATRRQPIGLDQSCDSAKTSLNIIVKLLEPHQLRLIRLFMSKVNVCIPMFERQDMFRQGEDALSMENFSPGLLACLYAHSLVYWASDEVLASQHRPDQRFIWNLANEALYSEMRLNPSIYTIAAVLLNVGGRPTTLVFNNAGQLGFAISIAFTLGLNRDPSDWDIPASEKCFRIKIWLGLVIHDRWSSLAFSTPPRIRPGHTDVSASRLNSYLYGGMDSVEEKNGADILIALTSLSNILYEYLDQLHQVALPLRAETRLQNMLHTWSEGTSGTVRSIVLRGTDLSLPGAANLRLCFLHLEFLDSRIRLEVLRKDALETDSENLISQYLSTRRAAENIVMLVSELSIVQLRDFWLPEAAFCLSTVLSFLLRSALEMKDSAAGLPRGNALESAVAMMESLRSHRDSANWDIGDLCLSQYSDIYWTRFKRFIKIRITT